MYHCGKGPKKGCRNNCSGIGCVLMLLLLANCSGNCCKGRPFRR